MNELGEGDPRGIANKEQAQEFLAKSSEESVHHKARGEGSAAVGDDTIIDVISGGNTAAETRCFDGGWRWRRWGCGSVDARRDE